MRRELLGQMLGDMPGNDNFGSPKFIRNGAFHWNDEARVMKQSPHHYAQNFNTPTLVIHGEQD